MSSLRRQMIDDLALGGYAESTSSRYIKSIEELALYFGRSPAVLDQDELRQYTRYLRKERCQSASRMRCHLAAMKFLYRKTLGRSELVAFLSWPSEPERMPVVLSVEEVAALLGAIEVPVYRAVATTLYATGLRLREACLVETRDVDAAREVIHVRHGKGRKERFVPLSPKLLGLLRRHWAEQRPDAPYLFGASLARGHVRAPSVRAAIKRAAVSAGIDKKVTPHVLRHTFATHLLEAGVEMRVIQVVLGHASIRTTTRYARVSKTLIGRTASLLEQLPL